jgi:hypothetical protein
VVSNPHPIKLLPFDCCATKLCPNGTTLSSRNCKLVFAWFLRSAEIRIARRHLVTRKPERDQKNQLTNQYVDPHRDLKKERLHVLIPSEERNTVFLEHREESLSPAPQQSSTRKEYGFRLLDPAKGRWYRDGSG